MSKFHELTVAGVRPETRDALVVTLVAPAESREAFRYEAGQHLTLRAHIDGSEVRRSYSICSSAQEQVLRIAIKRVDDGLFSNWAADNLQAGHRVEVMEPSGHFNVPLQPQARRHHVAFAAGSGITPILSLIKTTLQAEPLSHFTLIYGNRASSSVIFKDELEDLKDSYLSRLRLVFILSREQQDVDLFNGRIDAAKCEALLKSWVRPEDIDIAYVCGPQTMMEQVQATLMAHGIAKSNIKLELFSSGLNDEAKARRATRARVDGGCRVIVIQEGRTREFTMPRNVATVLDAALEQGIELPYACKGGVCSTCRCKRIRGEVDMDANYSLEDYELARGFILACQSYPVSEELMIDFDQET